MRVIRRNEKTRAFLKRAEQPRVQTHVRSLTCSFTSWQTLFFPDRKVTTVSRWSRNFTSASLFRKHVQNIATCAEATTVRYVKLVIRPLVNLNLPECQRVQSFRGVPRPPGFVVQSFWEFLSPHFKRGFVYNISVPSCITLLTQQCLQIHPELPPTLGFIRLELLIFLVLLWNFLP